MKRLKFLVVIKAIFIVVYLINFNIESIDAQDIGIFNARPVSKPAGGNKTGNGGRARANVAAVRTIYKIEYREKETPKLVKPTGLSITTLPFADVTLKPIKGAERKFKADASGVIFSDTLKPGTYKLTALAEDYVPQESEIIIQPQKIATIPIALKKVTYDFSIETNVDKGEARYAPVKVIGDNPDGTKKVQEIGGYCVAPVKDKKAVIDDLSKGEYYIKVSSPDNPEYEEETAYVRIPEDVPEEKEGEANASAAFSIPLEYKLSTKTFNQIFTSDAWELPQNWRIDSKGLKGNSVGIALPKENDYRNYKDFELNTSVRLIDDTSVGFVLRAVDNNNYYLIKLTGAASIEPYRVSAFIVKDGKPRRVMENPINFLAGTIGNKKYFGVIIKAKGDLFEISIADSETGKSYPLGNAEFNNNFRKGAVGIGVMEKSNFEIGLFSVCYQICK